MATIAVSLQCNAFLEYIQLQVNAKKEKTSRVQASSPKSMKKCVMKKETSKKNDTRIKMLLMEFKESFFRAHTKTWGKRSQCAESLITK